MSDEKIYAKGYKGFNRGMKCLDKQYSENAVFEERGGNICGSGVMHFCECPLSVFSYYPPVQGQAGKIVHNEYASVVALAECQRDGNKSATAKLKIGAKINIAGICKAQVEYIKEKHTPATTGDYAHSATTGANSIAASLGRCGWAKAAMDSWIVLAEYDKTTGELLRVKTTKIDGEKLKANTFYKLENGKFMEAENE